MIDEICKLIEISDYTVERSYSILNYDIKEAAEYIIISEISVKKLASA